MAEEIIDCESMTQSKSWWSNCGEYGEDTGLSMKKLQEKVIQPMLHAEVALWEATTPAAILSIINSYSTPFISETIWEDMFKLLAVKRLRFDGHVDEAKTLMKTLKYRGYGFFMRRI
jgi:hypothetical protein